MATTVRFTGQVSTAPSSDTCIDGGVVGVLVAGGDIFLVFTPTNHYADQALVACIAASTFRAWDENAGIPQRQHSVHRLFPLSAVKAGPFGMAADAGSAVFAGSRLVVPTR